VNDADHEDDGPTARQTARVATLIDDAGAPEVTADSQTTLELHCALATVQPMSRCTTSSCAFTTRRSATWVYDARVPSLGRVLNATRVKAITTAPRPEAFKCKEHRAKLLAQFRNTAEQDGILTSFLNVREEGLSAIPWISERRSQRPLLEQ
jgi:hypothetical protein